VIEPAERAAERCANCDHELHGEFCSACGQSAHELHRPVGEMVSHAFEDLLHLDTRFIRTVWPLLLKPGEVMRKYLAGQRVAFVPPLRTYLIAALAFFGVFALLAEKPKVTVVTTGSPEAEAFAAARKKGGNNGVLFNLPPQNRLFGRAYETAVARAKADPQAFGHAVFGNIPRSFFVLLPVFALLLKLFYRSRYYIEHLVFSLYYHAFVFSWFTLILLVGAGDRWMFPSLRIAIGVAMGAWMAAYLPLALRRVYRGSWVKTLLKVFGLGLLYVMVMVTAMVAATFGALLHFG
jgi:uncharacterized protein DUF3667